WLVGISWWRFFLLAVLLLIVSGILSNLPPFSWTFSERIEAPRPRVSQKTARAPHRAYEITIDEHGVKVVPRAAAPAASAPQSAASATSGADEVPPMPPEPPSIDIRLPKGATSDEVKEAVEEARAEIEKAIDEAKAAARDEAGAGGRERVVRVSLGDYLPQAALLFILASAIVKINYKGRLQAEVKAAQATETAESESLKRQVVEARMAAMQAQVEPHFLFNTLASIDHLIETDPPRASAMQKNLIALLRASMPTLRETGANGSADLGRELAVVRPYLEILKVRMEDRLATEIDVPEGLLSAQFPPMMMQSLVENAVKHGLEPKPEGGRLTVRAEVVHGMLQVTVADTGLGFGKAATAGTGTGLANIRERLQLLYGDRATLAVSENAPSGTRVVITVPYATQRAPGGGARA
ncbi:MAG TPA: sensor histidine kinase, partial [Ideonella sp.]|nr:sensor histidine kinase [Ideonella sp.]